MHFLLNEFWSLTLAAVFVQNVIFVQLMVSNSFFKSVSKPLTGFLYTGSITVAMTLASAGAWALDRLVLAPFGVRYLSPLAFALVVAALEVAAECLLRRLKPALHERLGTLLPATAFNCAVLGVVFLNVEVYAKGFWGTVYYGFCAGLGVMLAFLIAWAAAEKLRFSEPPESFRGLPIALVTAGIVSLAFTGFLNIQIPY